MSSTKRNKVKSFGDLSIDHEEMEDQFLVVGALKAPPLFQIGLRKFELLKFFFCFHVFGRLYLDGKTISRNPDSLY